MVTKKEKEKEKQKQFPYECENCGKGMLEPFEWQGYAMICELCYIAAHQQQEQQQEEE